MTEVLFAAVIVLAVLAGSFTELFFRKVWPLIELSIRQRMRQPVAETADELDALRRRLEVLERGAGRPG